MWIRRQTSRRLAGALLLTGVIGSAVASFMFVDLVEIMRGRSEVVVVLDEAGGVRRGTPVWIAGKPAGRVKRVEFLPRRPGAPARLAITLEIVGSDFDKIRASSTVHVTSEGPVSGPVIDILPAPATNPPLAANDTLYGRRARTTTEAVRGGAASLKASIDSLADAAASIAAPTRQFAIRADHIQRNLASIQTEVAAIQRFLRPDDDGRVVIDSAFLEKVERLMATAQEVGAAFRQARSRYSGASAALVEPVARIQRRADTLSMRIASFRTLIDRPTSPGAPARLRADSAIFLAIRGVRAQLDTLIAEVRDEPFRFAF